MTAKGPDVQGEGWLDDTFLTIEVETLGFPMLTELLDMFANHLPDVFTQMDMALQHRQWPQLCKLAHRLRGSAANLGLRQLMDDAREFELAATSDAPEADHMHGLFIRLKEDARHSCQLLRQQLKAGSA